MFPEPLYHTPFLASTAPGFSRASVEKGPETGQFDRMKDSGYNRLRSEYAIPWDGSMEETFDACIAYGRSLGFEEEHCRQDAKLAVQLFDLLADLHGLGDEERDLLYAAGLLHDIGYVEGYWGHHKTAYKLILRAGLPGLDEREKRIVANVARYHRGARPKLSHNGFAALEPDDREVVEALGGLLRLADGLDRSHTDAVRDIEARLDGEELTLLVECPFGCSTEVWAGEKKGRFLGEVLGLRIQVRERVDWDAY
jgi:exopolyphosphatase/guanosine-5'-triphosphate,3'-diphosphate pyrophosphatase